MRIAILSCQFAWSEKQIITAAQDLGHHIIPIHPRDIIISVAAGTINLGLLDNTDRVLIRRTLQNSDAICIICEALQQRHIPTIEKCEHYLKISGSKIQSIIKRRIQDYTPTTWAIWKGEQLELIRTQLSWPLLVKPDKGTCGHGIICVDNFDDLNELASRHFQADHYNPFVCQQKLNRLREYRVLVLNGKAIATVIKCVAPDKLVANAAAGTKFVDARSRKINSVEISNVEKLAVDAATNIHGLIFAGVDVLIDVNKHLYILECNRNPQFKATQSAVKKVSIAEQVIETLINLTI